nr:MAG TPA: hypothetical protein [Caudoviricetes sp.]
MRTIVRDLSRRTRQRFSQPRHAWGPSLRPSSRRSLRRSPLNESLTIAKPISGRRRTSPGGRSSQYLIGCTFPQPSQGLQLWYRLSRQTVSSMLVERRLRWPTRVQRRLLDDTASRWRTWLNRRTWLRLRPALQRNRLAMLLRRVPELSWSHRPVTSPVMTYFPVDISSPTSKPFVESKTTSTGSSTQSATLPLTSSTPDLGFRQLPPVSLLDGLIPTPSPWNSGLSLPTRGSLS